MPPDTVFSTTTLVLLSVQHTCAGKNPLTSGELEKLRATFTRIAFLDEEATVAFQERELEQNRVPEGMWEAQHTRGPGGFVFVCGAKGRGPR